MSLHSRITDGDRAYELLISQTLLPPEMEVCVSYAETESRNISRGEAYQMKGQDTVGSATQPEQDASDAESAESEAQASDLLS